MIETCKICSTEQTFNKIVNIQDPSQREDFLIKECPNCSVKMTSPIPEDLDKYYEVSLYNKKQNSLYRFLKNLLIRFEIKRLIKFTHSEKFLDIGSGSGEFSFNLNKMGLTTAAADFSKERPYYIESIPEIPYARFNFDSCELDQPELAKNRTIVIRHVLEHIKDPKSFLKKFESLSAEYLYIVVPNGSCVENNIFKHVNTTWNAPQHLWHFNQLALQKLLKNIDANIVAHGFDTIPMFLIHFHCYLAQRNFPEFITNLFRPNGANIALFSPINLLLPKNVIWVIAKIGHE